MSGAVEIRCRCGEVHGRVENASRDTVNRMICYCADCQAYLHHLGRADLLDDHGGTDIVQVAPARLAFDRGADRIVCLRLTPKGLYRHHATCCNTPLGNTHSPGVPFVGIVTAAFDGGAAGCDARFGPPAGAILGKKAVGTPPPGSMKVDWSFIARALRLVLGWRLRGEGWPHPFFDRATKKASRPITVLSTAEREALRPLCGPLATTIARP